jgi:acyl carrier protein
MFFIDRKMDFSTSVIPVGYAVDDTDILVLDEDGKVAAESEAGEIVVKSPYIAQGYWQRPELSAQTFVSDGTETNLRSFHSRDLGFKSADGCITHLGRNDRQAKIRGHRVEMAELESELMSVAGVKEAAVAIRDDAFGNTELVAYVVPIAETRVTASDLRLALAEKLPPEMIPAKTVVVEALPVTPNGKLNRRALPKPANIRPELAVAYVAPVTPVEKELSRIWTEILALDRVGVLDDFFDLGGHSLAATRVVSQVLKYFQFEIPLRSLFESPTVAQMAEVVEEHRGELFSDEDLEHVLAEIESLSEDEAQKTLAEKHNS